MSDFAVTIEKIEEVRIHSNADRLELVKLFNLDYQMIVPKGEYEENHLVIYFPLDSKIPEDKLVKMGLSGVLFGKSKDIVKTIKLRGEISQGLVCKPQLFFSDGSLITKDDSKLLMLGNDVTELLGVTKHDPQPVVTKSGNLHHLPPYVAKYDIENAERYGDIVDLLMDTKVCITEKLEGSHWACSLNVETGRMRVFQRNYEIIETEGKEHTWWKAFREGGFERHLNVVKECVDGWENCKNITMRGELTGPGIQGNIYKFTKHRVFLFEIEFDGIPVDAFAFNNFCTQFTLPRVPVISKDITLREWLEKETLPSKSNGNSMFNWEQKREGVVIKPKREFRKEGFGRVFIKQRSPEYLMR